MGYMYALSWKLLIIGLLSEYFAKSLKKTTPEENSHKMFHISSPIVLFSYGKVKDIFGDKDQISSVKDKRVRGIRREKPKMRVVFAKFPLLSKIQTLSHKLLVRQTSNHHHYNWHAQKPIGKDFQVILSSSS